MNSTYPVARKESEAERSEEAEANGIRDKEDYCSDILEDFWNNYVPESDEYLETIANIVQLALIGSDEFNIPLRVLNSLSRCCKMLFSTIQYRLSKSKKIRDNWLPKFASRLSKYLLNRDHPIKYTSSCIKTISCEQLAIDDHGIRFLDVPGLFEDPLRYAVANISLRAREPIDFMFLFMIVEDVVFSRRIQPSDFIDTGPITDSVKQHYLEKYGTDTSVWPGRYLINLNLPMQQNPITLGRPILDTRLVHIVISNNYVLTYDEYGESALDFVNDPYFIADHFTHVIANFKTIEQTAYKWDDFAITYSGKINHHVYTSSLIKRIDSLI